MTRAFILAMAFATVAFSTSFRNPYVGSLQIQTKERMIMEDSPESMPMALREDDKPEPSFTPILAENACLINCFAAVPNEDCTACGPCLPNTEAGCKNAAFIFDRDTCSCKPGPVDIDFEACDKRLPDCPEHQVKNLDICQCQCNFTTRTVCEISGFYFDENTCRCTAGSLTCPPNRIPNVKRGTCDCEKTSKESCERLFFENVDFFQDPKTCACAFNITG